MEGDDQAALSMHIVESRPPENQTPAIGRANSQSFLKAFLLRAVNAGHTFDLES